MSEYRRLVHGAFATPKYLPTYGCPPIDFLGPTGLGSEGASNGLPNDTVYITPHLCYLAMRSALVLHACSWTTRKAKKVIRVIGAGTFGSPVVSNTNWLPAER
jgi:hypothetical protein